MNHRWSYIKAWTLGSAQHEPLPESSRELRISGAKGLPFQSIPGTILLPCVNRILLALFVHSRSENGSCGVYWCGKLALMIYKARTRMVPTTRKVGGGAYRPLCFWMMSVTEEETNLNGFSAFVKNSSTVYLQHSQYLNIGTKWYLDEILNAFIGAKPLMSSHSECSPAMFLNSLFCLVQLGL